MAYFRHGTPVMADYTPVSAVVAGQVLVIGSGIRIAHRDIAAGVLGAVALGFGCYALPKATTGGSGIAAGTKVYWDATNLVVTTTATANNFLGYTETTSADADTVQNVLHMPD